MKVGWNEFIDDWHPAKVWWAPLQSSGDQGKTTRVDGYKVTLDFSEFANRAFTQRVSP